MTTQIEYLTGDATTPEAAGTQIITHVCNDIGGWGSGFVVAVSRRWPEPEARYRAWYAEREQNDFALGSVQLVEVEPQLWVANLVGQRGIRRGGKGPAPVRYEAIRAGLEKVGTHAIRLNASVHMPRIGCGLAGGNWEQVEAIIAETLCAIDVPVFVYDLPSAPA